MCCQIRIKIFKWKGRKEQRFSKERKESYFLNRKESSFSNRKKGKQNFHGQKPRKKMKFF